MTDAEKLDRIDQRRRYLLKRVQAKVEMGWENTYDREEAEALTWALNQIRPGGWSLPAGSSRQDRSLA